jgi:two-component system sensor histidine kinase UhpB
MRPFEDAGDDGLGPDSGPDRPPILDDLGLEGALHWLAGQHVGLDIEIQVTGLGPHLEPMVETTAFRVVEEALSNTARHAGVDRAEVVVRLASGHLEVGVADDGCGFAADLVGEGSGLETIRDRISRCGGRFHLTSRPGDGTRIHVYLPVRPAEV